MTPLVADGVVYVTESRSQVAALDVRTGRTLWRYDPQVPKNVRAIGYFPVNRGVALLDDRVYVGTLDARLVALDAASGVVRWDDQGCRQRARLRRSRPHRWPWTARSSSASAAARPASAASSTPTTRRRASESGGSTPSPAPARRDTTRGAATAGRPAARRRGSPAATTRSSTCSTGASATPRPDWNGDSRPGDNLYSCSVVALDARTGRAAMALPVHPARHARLGRQPDPGAGRRRQWAAGPRALVVTANRNGFYYVLDRATGEFLAGTAYAEADLGPWPRRARAADRDPRHRTVRGGHAGVAQPAGRHQLVQPVVRRRAAPAVRAGARNGIEVLQGRGRVRAGQALHGRRGGHRRAGRCRTAPCARSTC